MNLEWMLLQFIMWYLQEAVFEVKFRVKVSDISLFEILKFSEVRKMLRGLC